jgi:tetratricopeptide (TPR) repeat protein
MSCIMLDFGWMTLKQAQEALKTGRLDECRRLLEGSEVRGHKRAFELQRDLAAALVERGQQHLRANEHDAAWDDLAVVEQLGQAPTAAQLRQELVRIDLEGLRTVLAAGELTRAGALLERLRSHQVRQPEMQMFAEVAEAWIVARELADRGEFAQAQQALERAKRPFNARTIEDDRRGFERRRGPFMGLLVQLHEATAAGQWRDVVRLTDEVLALAPQNGEARKARARAWQAIEPVTTVTPRTDEPQREPPARFLLWIDGVGGYLVCLKPRVTLGQAAPDSFVDVPLLADISRLHAALTRDAEGYLFEAFRCAQVNGQATEKTLLHDGDRVTLGDSCQIQFQRPVAVSSTARLDLVSGHRLPLALDGVLLMADTLVLGPGQAHVAIADAPGPIVLYRQKEGLALRHGGRLTVNGAAFEGRGVLPAAATVSGDGFAFAVESVGQRLGRSGT